jgi:gluconolactonase
MTEGTKVAEGLDFPEGPVAMPDGSIVFTEITGGRLRRYRPGPERPSERDHGEVAAFAQTDGGPNGATLGADGSIYVTQNGGMFRDDRVTAGIQRVAPDGEVSMLVTEIAGLTLDGPNDLAFGPDGRLWFTDPRGDADPSKNSNPGRLFAYDVASGEGELIRELDAVFPNGIGFLPDGTLVWTESFSLRVMTLDGPLIQLPEYHFPDGFCVGADGALYVATTYAHCVSVIRDGQIVEQLECGDGMCTNACFVGTDLYVTESRHGALWRFALGVEGLPLHAG